MVGKHRSYSQHSKFFEVCGESTKKERNCIEYLNMTILMLIMREEIGNLVGDSHIITKILGVERWYIQTFKRSNTL